MRLVLSFEGSGGMGTRVEPVKADAVLLLLFYFIFFFLNQFFILEAVPMRILHKVETSSGITGLVNVLSGCPHYFQPPMLRDMPEKPFAIARNA